MITYVRVAQLVTGTKVFGCERLIPTLGETCVYFTHVNSNGIATFGGVLIAAALLGKQDVDEQPCKHYR